jgi:predicted MFS family arabinose efflux permease
MGIVALGAVALILPKTKRPRYVALDTIGLLSMISFLVPLLLALIQGRREGWDSRYIQTLFAIAVVSGVVFVVTELRLKQPLVDLRLFKIVPFSAASAIFLIGTMGEFASSFLIALFLQQVITLTPYQAGKMLLPGALIWGCTNLISGRLADKVNNRLLVSIALLMIAVAFYRFASLDKLSSSTSILSLFAVQSFARGMLQSPLINFLMAVLPQDKVIMGSGLRGLVNGLGSTFGVSMAAIFIEQQQAVHALIFSEDQSIYPIGAIEAVSAAQEHLRVEGEWDLLSTKATLALRNVMLGAAAVLAYRDCYMAIAVSSLVSLALTLFLRLPQRRR